MIHYSLRKENVGREYVVKWWEGKNTLMSRRTAMSMLTTGILLWINLLGVSYANVKTTEANPISSPVTVGIQGALAGPFLPYRSPDAIWHNLIDQQFAPILHLGAKDQVEPEIVSTWWYSANGKQLFLKINPKAVWSDGQPVTASDIQLSIDYLSSPFYNSVYHGHQGYRVLPIVGSQAEMNGSASTVSGVHIISQQELSLTLKETNPSILTQDLQGIIPVPSHLLAKVPFTAWSTNPVFRSPSVGDGPYLLVDQLPGRIIMDANTHFVLGVPTITTIRYLSILPSAVTGVYEAGGIDVLSGLTPAQANLFAKTGNVIKTPMNQYDFLGFDDQLPATDNRVFREALLYAINREKIVDSILGGYATIQNGPIPTNSTYYDPALTGQYAYAPQTARDMLTKAGFYIASSSWLVTPSGHPITIVINYAQGDPNSRAIATQISNDLQNIGINTSIEGPLTVQAMNQAIQNHDSSTIQAYLMGWQLGADPSPTFLWSSTAQLNLATMNWTDMSKPGVVQNQQLIASEQSLPAQNSSVRQAMLRQWDDLINQSVPEEFLYEPDLLGVVSTRVTGVVWSGLYGPIDTWKWRLTQS